MAVVVTIEKRFLQLLRQLLAPHKPSLPERMTLCIEGEHMNAHTHLVYTVYFL